MPSIELFTPNDREDDMGHRIQNPQTLRLMILAMIIVPVILSIPITAKADWETALPQDVSSKRALSLEVFPFGISACETSIRHVPDDIRQVTPYRRQYTKTLNENTGGVYGYSEFGLGLLYANRFEWTARFGESFNSGGGNRTSWSEQQGGYLSDDYVGYRIKGRTLRTNFGVRVYYPLFLQLGYLFQSGYIQNGADAWGIFRPEHAVKLPKHFLFAGAKIKTLSQVLYFLADTLGYIDVELGGGVALPLQDYNGMKQVIYYPFTISLVLMPLHLALSPEH